MRMARDQRYFWGTEAIAALAVPFSPAGQQAERGAQLGIDLAAHFRILFQELAGVVAALADALALVAEPGAALLDQVAGDADVEQITFARGALRRRGYRTPLRGTARPLCSLPL